jgi:phytanoyl-CoA hydroxylase
MNTSTPATPYRSESVDPSAFADQGYLVLRGLLGESDLKPVRDELSAMIDRRARALHASGSLRDLHEDAPFATRFGLLMAEDPAIQDGFDVTSLRGPAMWRFLRTPRLLDAVEALIGPEISLNPIAHVRAKPPQSQTADRVKGFFSVPWHQDSAVMLPEADGSEIITVWLPLLDATEEMGCLTVLPGAHKAGHLPHEVVPAYGTAIIPAAMPRIPPARLPVRRGDVILMHRHCPHHSAPNRSQVCRWSLDLRFQRTGDHCGRPWQPVLPLRSGPHGDVDPGHAVWDRAWAESLANGGGRVVHRIGAARDRRAPVGSACDNARAPRPGPR